MTLSIRPPWTDPRLASIVDFEGPGRAFLDLNARFRAHLTTPDFLTKLAQQGRRSIAALEREPHQRGASLWTLYRAVKLVTVVEELLQSNSGRFSQEALQDFFHLLGTTGFHWYFTSQRGDAGLVESGRTAIEDGSLGPLGEAFGKFLETSGTLQRGKSSQNIVILIDDEAQLPFARLLTQALRSSGSQAAVRIECGATLDSYFLRLTAESFERGVTGPGPDEIGPILSKPLGTLATRFFKRNPKRLLRVSWRPKIETYRRGKLRRILRALKAFGVPVALDVSPFIAAETEAVHSRLFSCLDEIIGEQTALDGVRISVRPSERPISEKAARAQAVALRALSDMLSVQLEAELENVRLIPHRTAKPAIGPTSKLQATHMLTIRSRFDLAAISEQLGSSTDAQPYRFGRGRPRAATPTFHSATRVRSYMVFVGCARVIPMVAEEAGYAEAIAFFQTPRTARGFVEQYRAEERGPVLAFLEELVDNQILRLA